MRADQIKRFAVFLAVTAAGWSCLQATAQPQPANVILIVSDDHHHTALGCAGDKVIKTPALDRLAADGVRFTRCFTPNPICTPSRACILTGQDSFTNGCTFFGKPIKSTSPLWARLLAQGGYQTFYTGKWHNDGLPWTRGFRAAANVWAGGKYDHAHLPVLQLGQDKKQRKIASKNASELFVDAAINFLQKRDTTTPFAIFLSFTAPHDPWVPPKPYDTIYKPADMRLPVNFRPRPPFKIHESFPNLRDQKQLPFPRTKKDVQWGLSQYYGMISHMDTQIGRLLDKLDQLKLAQSTMVIFVGDHGYSMGSHGFVGKQTMNEEGIRTPLIIRYPKLKRGRTTVDHLVSLVDIFPTICGAADVTVPKSVEGRSLLDLYQGSDKPLRDAIYAAFVSPTRHYMDTRCVRTQRYKLIRHLLTGETELFDLKTDPYEMTNLAGKAPYKRVESELSSKLDAWLKRNAAGQPK